jgi:hypothetical protein
MKRLRILFAIIFLLTFISISYSAEWEIYTKSILGIHYYDKENIKHMPNNIIRVWEKTIYSDAGKEDSIKDLGDRFKDINYTVTLNQINCNEKMYRAVLVADYDSKGSAISSYDNPILKETIILPESVIERLYKIVCKETKQ